MKEKQTLILVEDDKRLSQLVADFLQGEGFDVICLYDGTELLAHIQKHKPQVVVLDVMLPGVDGFTLCKQIRPYYTGPLLFMTAKHDNIDQVLGLEIGADDYVIKPVEPRVLLARIHALLRRARPVLEADTGDEQLLVFGQLSINRSSRQVLLHGEDIVFTSHEFDMLWLLATHASELVDRSTLYSELIGREYDGLDRSADVRISRIRKKLKDNPQNPFRIKTIWGKGFFFVADAWD